MPIRIIFDEVKIMTDTRRPETIALILNELQVAIINEALNAFDCHRELGKFKLMIRRQFANDFHLTRYKFKLETSLSPKKKSADDVISGVMLLKIVRALNRFARDNRLSRYLDIAYRAVSWGHASEIAEIGEFDLSTIAGKMQMESFDTTMHYLHALEKEKKQPAGCIVITGGNGKWKNFIH